MNAKHLIWSDIVFVMENHHKEKIMRQFPNECKHIEIVTLEIPDQYKYMDKELIEEIQDSVSCYIPGQA